MTHVFVLDFMSKDLIDDYASIESIYFGDIILTAMGIKGGCTLFRKSKLYNNAYLFGWWNDDGTEHVELFSYEQIMAHLRHKTLKLTMDITRDM